jgi:transposase InsO family protein
MITITMDDSHVVSIAQLRELLKVTNKVECKSKNKKATYEWIGRTLGRFKYFSKNKKEKSIIKQYITQFTGLSDPHVKKLIRRKKETGRIELRSTARHHFPTVYTTDDIARIVETDNAHNRLSGPATKKLFERAYTIFGDMRYERLKDISVSHLYNLRETRQYRSHALTYAKTNPVNIPIGERRKPNPNGIPGYLRIDTVHQGDLNNVKGIYHINVVDEVTQWELIGCVEKISEAYLAPLLEDLLAQFPFRIIGFHSDCGSEFINEKVARMLNKMLVEQTKSRARHCNDNALVEGKNGSIIRKYFGYGYVPKQHASLINEFYRKYFNGYLNFHRPCGFATVVTDKKGKQKKTYDTYLTPYEKLKSLDHPKRYLKSTVTLRCLDIIATNETDNECAASMQKARVELFTKIHKKS